MFEARPAAGERDSRPHRTLTPRSRRHQRRPCACVLLFLCASTASVHADELQQAEYVPSLYSQKSVMIDGPKCLGLEATSSPYDTGLQFGSVECPPGTHADFLRALRQWRSYRRLYTGYDGSRYDSAALKWTQSNYVQPQAMVEDRFLFDPALGKYTVERYLADVDRRYGGIDSILLWPVYPNLGIDNRNQLDMIRAMPGGVAGVSAMIAEFHRHGVRVLFPMAMWDQGTRDPGQAWPAAIAQLMKEIGADGVNGDTQHGVPPAFPEASERIGHPLAFQPEEAGSDEMVAWNTLSWWEEGAKVFSQFVPKIYRYKWIEPRHMANISNRLGRDHADDLQLAFFNGIGFESWENVWGIWNGITPRDGEALRRMAAIERGISSFLVSPDWEPFYPVRTFGVYASRWPLERGTAWTIVNRNEYTVDGRLIAVPFRRGERYFDLYHGTELKGEQQGTQTVLSVQVEAHGFGAILALYGDPDPATRDLMARMKTMSAQPLSRYPHDWEPLPQHIVDISLTRRREQAPDGMVEIPEGEFEFVVQGLEVEGDNAIGVDVAYPWEDSPRRFHAHTLAMNRFYMDRFPVTNEQFKQFLAASGYRPADAMNFLKDWVDGTYPRGWGNKPVTWVSLEDARAYAAWAGKRLPHEWEWQYAAQGSDGRRYPWGREWDGGVVPIPEQGRSLRGPDDVSAHPAAASPFSVMDMVGNVWQWTDEFVDEHTRTAVVRGGSYYQPQGSAWYFPQAYRNDQHGKMLLMAPGKDRAATVGFRCVADAKIRVGRERAR